MRPQHRVNDNEHNAITPNSQRKSVSTKSLGLVYLKKEYI